MSTNQSSPPSVPSTALDLPREKLDLLKRTIARDTTDDEFELFLHVCRSRRIDPFAKLLYPVKRWDKKVGGWVMQLQSSIDSFRLQAERTGKYAGQLGPQWCGADGKWADVWLDPKPPAAARVGVLRVDFKEPLWTVALWSNYVQLDKEGRVTQFWGRMGPLMLAKCAEALALRRAFPEDLAGLYTADEMAQAENEAPRDVQAEPKAAPALPPAKPTIDSLAKASSPPAKPQAAPPAKAEKAWSKTWQANPEKKLETRIPVSLPMWNLWADQPTGLGPFVDKGHDTWRKVSRGSLEGYRHKMLLAAVEHAEKNPEEAEEYHERAACTLAVLLWLNANKPPKAETEPPARPSPAEDEEASLFQEGVRP